MDYICDCVIKLDNKGRRKILRKLIKDKSRSGIDIILSNDLIFNKVISDKLYLLLFKEINSDSFKKYTEKCIKLGRFLINNDISVECARQITPNEFEIINKIDVSLSMSLIEKKYINFENFKKTFIIDNNLIEPFIIKNISNAGEIHGIISLLNEKSKVNINFSKISSEITLQFITNFIDFWKIRYEDEEEDDSYFRNVKTSLIVSFFKCELSKEDFNFFFQRTQMDEIITSFCHDNEIGNFNPSVVKYLSENDIFKAGLSHPIERVKSKSTKTVKIHDTHISILEKKFTEYFSEDITTSNSKKIKKYGIHFEENIINFFIGIQKSLYKSGEEINRKYMKIYEFIISKKPEYISKINIEILADIGFDSLSNDQAIECLKQVSSVPILEKIPINFLTVSNLKNAWESKQLGILLKILNSDKLNGHKVREIMLHRFETINITKLTIETLKETGIDTIRKPLTTVPEIITKLSHFIIRESFGNIEKLFNNAKLQEVISFEIFSELLSKDNHPKLTCRICYVNEFDSVFSCGHAFCGECIKMSKGKCPMCRGNFDQIKIFFK